MSANEPSDLRAYAFKIAYDTAIPVSRIDEKLVADISDVRARIYDAIMDAGFPERSAAIAKATSP